ncbi:50S ribosomal protein L7ae [Bacillus thuringiensis serovar medellin]|uniref:50S ribosomal protein L7ae n=1 Tax=Bacillus thuringiensis subsp. medellin TaxID=79672 RepID=A0A9X6R875_BACTV|nr:50S ribosomal protein L7ae [Bacillus thuringiensis]OUB82600.1 50S ribosomal protein L7ae [Bacillus thuringiensis serovar medellin]
MGVNSYYTYITIKEVIFIHAYVTGEEIPSSQALQILGQFDSEEISGTIRETRRYRIRKNGEELFQYYREKHPKLFEKQRLYTYEELKHRAVYYCSSHLMIHM